MPSRGLTALLLFALAAVASGCATHERAAPVPAAAMDPLQAWLRGHPGYCLLTDEDCACAADLKTARAANRAYSPYRTVGDFNKDGKEDLAVAVASPADKGRFRVLVFNDHKAAGASAPWLSPPFSRGNALFFGPPAGGERLLVGPFESEGAAFVPVGRNRYRIENDL